MRPAVAISLMVGLFAGCATAVPLRTADLAGPGEFTWLVRATVPFEPGGFVMDAKDRRPVSTFGGVDGGTEASWWWAVLSFLAGLQTEAMFGVGDACEAGFLFGLERVGAQGRCALLDRREGDGVTLALSAAAGLVHWQVHPWARAGVELGGRTSAASPFVGAHVGFERALHPWQAGLFGGSIERDELRVHVVSGTGITLGDWNGEGSAELVTLALVGVSGYAVLWAGPARITLPGLNLLGGDRTPTLRFHRRFGASLLLGLSQVPDGRE